MPQQKVQQLEQELQRREADYIVDQVESEQACRIRFIGKFEHSGVAWHAHIQTLQQVASNLRQQTSETTAIRLRQFIEIQQQQDHYSVEVGLNLHKIDKAAILRTIIMIRQYKRLHAGRHEFGEWIEFQ